MSRTSGIQCYRNVRQLSITNNVQDDNGTNNNVKGQEDEQGDESKKKADMKKFECAICVGKLLFYIFM